MSIFSQVPVDKIATEQIVALLEIVYQLKLIVETWVANYGVG